MTSQVKERPIVLSAWEVNAILRERDPKTQTRRVVKPQPPPGFYRACWYSEPVMGWAKEPPLALEWHKVKSPYGVPGDRLWVKEAFQPLLAERVAWKDADYETGEGYAINYVATGGRKEYYDFSNDSAFCDRITSPIFMPRWASRITLEIADVRAQRLQDIGEEDALAEGVEATDGFHGLIHYRNYQSGPLCFTKPTAKDGFNSLWESINGKKHPWANNDWVWAYTFRRSKP